MIIDPSKVNLSEKDIEDWLWENPQVVHFSCWGGYETVERWIARQFSVPSGIIDLLGVSATGQIAVVEIKNTELQATALTQVKRYTFDIRSILGVTYRNGDYRDHSPGVASVVVGKSFDDKVFREAEALGITVITFSVRLSLNANVQQYTEQFENARESQWEEIAKNNLFEDAILQHETYLTERREKRERELAGILENADTEDATDDLATADDLGLE